jgi:hypothetical protein
MLPKGLAAVAHFSALPSDLEPIPCRAVSVESAGVSTQMMEIKSVSPTRFASVRRAAKPAAGEVLRRQPTGRHSSISPRQVPRCGR